jgi:hypothetical protein
MFSATFEFSLSTIYGHTWAKPGSVRARYAMGPALQLFLNSLLARDASVKPHEFGKSTIPNLIGSDNSLQVCIVFLIIYPASTAG